jgi:hypothetical protein
MSHWTEARGVFDDICYLRQAHLFQRFGLSGLDTDISRDDDHYLASKLNETGFNGAFFMSHNVVTPYYTVPIAMLSLWTLLFARIMPAPKLGTKSGTMPGT